MGSHWEVAVLPNTLVSFSPFPFKQGMAGRLKVSDPKSGESFFQAVLLNWVGWTTEFQPFF